MKGKAYKKIALIVLFVVLTASLVTGLTLGQAAVVEPDVILDGSNVTQQWAKAIYTSIHEGREVRVRLDADWVAPNGIFNTSDTVTIPNPYQSEDGNPTVEVDAFKDGQIYVPEGARIVIDLNHCSVNRNLVISTGSSAAREAKAKLNGSVFYVEGALTVRDDSTYADGTIEGGFAYKKVTLNGGSKSSDLAGLDQYTQELVSELRYNGEIDDSTEIYYLGFGGGVHVYGEQASLTLISGVITGNYAATGGGVCVDHYATFDMYGGTVQANEVWGAGGQHGGGGVAVYFGGTFNMFSGSIDHNYASYIRQSTADGMGNWGGGVLVWSIAQINNSNNYTTTSGEYVFSERAGQTQQSVFNMYGGTIANNQTNFLGAGVGIVGGGIRYEKYSSTTTKYPDGRTDHSGYDFSFFLTDDANKYPTTDKDKMSPDTAIRYSLFNFYGGALDNNVAQKRSGEDESKVAATYPVGGGVALFLDGAFVMHEGTVSNNFSQNVGGGIGLTQGGSNVFNMYGGTISGNTATGQGGGVNLSDWNDYFYMYGGTITGNIAGFANKTANDANTAGKKYIGGGVACSSDGPVYLYSETDAIQIYDNYVYYNKISASNATNEQAQWKAEYGTANIAKAAANDYLVECDVYLGSKGDSTLVMEVGSKLLSNGKATQIGVAVMATSSLVGQTIPITNGYAANNKSGNSAIPPSTFFFSNNSDLPYVKLSADGSEAALTSNPATTATIIWQYQIYGSTQWVTFESNNSAGAVSIEFTFCASGSYRPSGLYDDGDFLVLDPEDGVQQRKRIGNVRGYVVSDNAVDVYYWKNILPSGGTDTYAEYRGDDYLLSFIQKSHPTVSTVKNHLITDNGTIDFSVLQKRTENDDYTYMDQVDIRPESTFISGAGNYSFVLYNNDVIYSHPSLVITINQNEQQFNWTQVDWSDEDSIYTYIYDGQVHVPQVYALVNGSYINLEITSAEQQTRNVGSYFLRVTVNDSFTDKNYKLSFNNNGAGSIEFIRYYQILPRQITAPTVPESSKYTGETQLPDIMHNVDDVLGILKKGNYSDLYTLSYLVDGKPSSGITTIKESLTVVLTLLDPTNTAWMSDSIGSGVLSGANSETLTYIFTVVQANNEWTVEFERSGWTYGDEIKPEDTKAQAKFGNNGDITVTYYKVKDDTFDPSNPDESKLTQIPTGHTNTLDIHAGQYYAKVSLAGDEDGNYAAITSWYPIRIEQAHMDTPTINNYIYDGAVHIPDFSDFISQYKVFLLKGGADNSEVAGYGVKVSTHNGGNIDAYGMYTVSIKLATEVQPDDIIWNANGGIWDDQEQALVIYYTISRRKVQTTLSGSGVFNGEAQDAIVTFTDLLEENENVPWAGGAGTAFDTQLKTHYMVEYYYVKGNNQYEKVLSALHAGTYKGKVALTGTVANNYIIVSGDEGYDYGEYTITKGENEFTRHFSRDGWTQYHEVPTTDRLPIAKYGDSTQIEVTYWTGVVTGDKPTESEAALLTQFTSLFSRTTAAGTYWVKIFVSGEHTYGDYDDLVDWHELVISEAQHEITSFGTYIINSQDGVNTHARTCKVEGCPYRVIENCTDYNNEFGFTQHWQECQVCGHAVNLHYSMFAIDTTKGGQLQLKGKEVAMSSAVEAGWLWTQLEDGSFQVTAYTKCEYDDCQFTGTRTVVVNAGVYVGATCLTAGSMLYTAGLVLPHGEDSSKEFKTTYTEVGTDPLGHSWTVNTGKANTVNGWVLGEDKQSATLHLICETCKQQREVAATAVAGVKVPANCATKTNGYTPYTLTATVSSTDEQGESLNRFTSQDTFVGAEDGAYSATVNVEGTDDADDYDNVHSWEYTSLTGEGSNHKHVKRCSLCETTKIDGCTFEEQTSIDPTCDSNGYNVYKCKYCDFRYQEEDTEAQPTGHSWQIDKEHQGTNGWTWNADYTQATLHLECIKCNGKQTQQVTTVETGEVSNPVSGKIVKATTPATCEAGGNVQYVAQLEIAGQTYTSNVETQMLEALGHVYALAKDGVYVWSSTDGGVKATLKLVCTVCESGEGHEVEIEIDGYYIAVSESHGAMCDAAAYDVYKVTITTDVLASKLENGKLAQGFVLPTNTYTVTGAPATGHSYKLAEQAWSWEANGSKVTLNLVCEQCTDTKEVAIEGETYITSATTQPTCTAKGYTIYTVTITLEQLKGLLSLEEPDTLATSVTSEVLTDSYRVDGEGLQEHSWEYTSLTGEDANHKHVKRCSLCETTEIEKCEFEPQTNIQPTCDSNGYKVYKCKYCNYTYKEEDTQAPATGHSWQIDQEYQGTNGWTWNSDCTQATLHLECSKCHEKQTQQVTTVEAGEVTNPVSGKIVKATTSATCEAGGNVQYVAQLEIAGQTYTSNVETQMLEALGHVYALAKDGVYVWSSTDGGVKATLKLVCTVCESGEGHELEIVLRDEAIQSESKQATCEAAGYTTYTVNITLEEIASKIQNGKLAEGFVLPTNTHTVTGEAATGHAWVMGDWSWTKSNGNWQAVLHFECSNSTCNAQLNVSAEISSTTESATCEHVSSTTHTATVTYATLAQSKLTQADKFYSQYEGDDGVEITEETQALTDTNIEYGSEMAQHNYQIKWSVNGDNTIGNVTASMVCSVCSDSISLQVNVTANETKVTCLTAGETTYTLTAFYNGTTYTYDKSSDFTLTQQATGHKWRVYAEMPNTNNGCVLGEDKQSATLYLICDNCNEVHSITTSVEKSETVADCASAQDGNTSYTATVVIEVEDEDAEQANRFTANDTFNGFDASGVNNYTYTHTFVTDVVSWEDTHSWEVDEDFQDAQGWSWNDSYTQATLHLKCSKCSETLTFDVDEVEEGNVVTPVTDKIVKTTTDPSCEAGGKVEYVAQLEISGQTYTSNVETQQLQALGHNWQLDTDKGENGWNFSYDSATGSWTVTAHLYCGNGCDQTEVSVTANAQDVKITIAQVADCTTDRKDFVQATVTKDGVSFSAQKEATVAGTAYNHNVWEWRHDNADHFKYCLLCKQEIAQTRTAHQYNTNTVEPTHTSVGYTEHTCTLAECGYSYTDSYVSAQSHTWEVDEAASNTVKGWNWTNTQGVWSATTVYLKCSCGATATAEVTVASDTTASTCATAGKVIYTATASYDGKQFTSDQETTLQLDSSKHNWILDTSKGEDGWKWTLGNSGYTGATAYVVCSYCEETHDVAASLSSTTVSGSDSCDDPHQVKYTATASYGGKQFTSTRELTDVTNDHVWGNPEWVWGENHASAKLVFTCTKCSTKDEHVAHVSKVTVEATCKVGKYVRYTATVTIDDELYETSYDETLSDADSGAHEWGDWKQTKAPTCSAEGEEQRVCAVCSDKQTRSVSKVAHSYDSPEWTWSKDYSSATVAFKCIVCGHTEKVNATVKSETLDNATTHTATANFGGRTFTTSVPTIGTMPVDEEPTDYGLLIIAMLLQAPLLIIALILLIRKRKRK